MSTSNKPVTGVRSISEATAVLTDHFQRPGIGIGSDSPKNTEQARLVLAAAKPGLLRKLIPLRIDSSGVQGGGYHLFDTWENARDFANWMENEFMFDGYHFYDHPNYLEAKAQLWRIAGAEDFAPVESNQKLVRFQRWALSEAVDPVQLREKWWQFVREAAVERGLTSAWLLAGIDDHNRPELGLLFAADGNPNEAVKSGVDLLRPLESWNSPGERIAESLDGATKVLDRTSWIYNVWHPIEEGDTSPTNSQWPVSPPFYGL